MSSASVTDEHGGGGGAALLLLVVVGAIVYFSMAHATERHGAVAADVVNRCATGQWQAQWHNPATGRQARVCQISDGGFGIAIYEATDELVTAFKNKAKTLQQALKYLENAGYKP